MIKLPKKKKTTYSFNIDYLVEGCTESPRKSNIEELTGFGVGVNVS